MIGTTTTSSTCTCPSGDASLRWPCPTHPNANYTSLRHYGSPIVGQSAPASAFTNIAARGSRTAAGVGGLTDTNALFNGFDVTQLPPILISCVAKLWPGSNGLFWEVALEKMPERIEHLMARATAENKGNLTRTQTLQFLSDVATAAGLLSHGKRDKALARRISDRAYEMGASLHADAPVADTAGTSIGAGHFQRDKLGAWHEVPRSMSHQPGVVILYHGTDWPQAEKAACTGGQGQNATTTP